MKLAAKPLALLLVLLGTASAAEPPVVTPVVTRPPAAGPPVVWPIYSAASGGDEIRNCGWWRRGWREFVEDKALPAVRAHGRVWIHNPGGVVVGEAMRFQQFTETRQQAELTGNESLRKIADWREFTAQMNRIAAEGELLIYLGCPSQMRLRDGESDDQWFARALRELKPLLDIKPNPLVGFDATYGHPADPNRGQLARFGGADGLTARVIKHLVGSGHEVIVEPKILVSAEWLRGCAGVVAEGNYWEKQLRGRDVRLSAGVWGWGRSFKPTEIRGRQVRMLNRMWKDPIEDQRALIEATLASGYDVAIGAIEADKLRANP